MVLVLQRFSSLVDWIFLNVAGGLHLCGGVLRRPWVGLAACFTCSFPLFWGFIVFCSQWCDSRCGRVFGFCCFVFSVFVFFLSSCAANGELLSFKSHHKISVVPSQQKQHRQCFCHGFHNLKTCHLKENMAHPPATTHSLILLCEHTLYIQFWAEVCSFAGREPSWVKVHKTEKTTDKRQIEDLENEAVEQREATLSPINWAHISHGCVMFFFLFP